MITVGQFRQIQIKPGRRDEYLNLLKPLCRRVEQEPGTLVYLLHTDRDDPDSVWLYARFRDDEALAAHLSSNAYVETSAQIQSLILSTDDLDVELIGNKGIPSELNGLRRAEP